MGPPDPVNPPAAPFASIWEQVKTLCQRHEEMTHAITRLTADRQMLREKLRANDAIVAQQARELMELKRSYA